MSADEVVDEKSRRRRKGRAKAEEITDAEEIEEMEEAERSLTQRKGRATPSRRDDRQEKRSGNFVTRFFQGVVEYFRGVQDELSKVVWPDREELIRLTRIVLLVVAISAIALGTIAFLFTELFIFGLEAGNEWVFFAFFVIVGAAVFAAQRFSANREKMTPYR